VSESKEMDAPLNRSEKLVPKRYHQESEENMPFKFLQN